MTTYTIASGYDSWVSSFGPTTNFGTADVITVTASPTSIGYVYIPLPAELAGQTVSSATLTGVTAAAWASTTVTVKLPTSAWGESTVTYNRQPTIGATAVTSSPGATTAGQLVSLNVGTLVQAVASGQAFYGFQLTASVGISFNSFDSGLASWTLTIVTSDAPDTPTSLVPNGTVVGSGAPTLTCDFTDNGGLSNAMQAMNVQISTTSSFASPVYDQTGNTTIPVFNLASPPSPATAFTAVASGTTRYWRVRVQDTDGNWSGWSDPVSFTFRTQPTITLTTPAAGVIMDPTSSIVASTSANMSAYRVQITANPDRTDVRYDTGRVPANPLALTTISEPLPLNWQGAQVLVDETTYQLHIQAWDTFLNRQGTPGSPAYVESWTTFTFADDLTQTAVSTLTATQSGPSPSVTLTWTRATTPDAWLIRRDGKILDRLAPSDVTQVGTTYTWVDKHPQPWVSHTYDVRSIVNVSGVMKRSGPGPTPSITPGARGVWIRTDDGQEIVLDETDMNQLTVRDRMATYKPINLKYDVDIIDSHEGVSGTVAGVAPSGLVDSTVTVDAARAVMLSIKRKPSKPVSLVFGNFSGRVLLRNITILPDNRGNAAQPLLRISFDVNQVGRFDQVN